MTKLQGFATLATLLLVAAILAQCGLFFMAGAFAFMSAFGLIFLPYLVEDFFD